MDNSNNNIQSNKERLLWVDYLKAFACLAVVTFHVIYGLQNAGLPTHSYTNALKEFCDMFQIPLFMMASGFLYARAGRIKGSYFKFEAGKLINLGIPYLVFSYVYIAINTVFASSVNFSYDLRTILRVPIEPVAQYWFLFALILIFLFIVAIEKVIKNEYVLFGIMLIWKILIINMFLLGDKVLNIDYYIAGYGVFFYLGVLYARRHDDFEFLRNKKVVITLVAVYLVLFAAYLVRPQMSTRVLDMVKLFLNLLAITSFTLLFEMFWKRFECGFLKLISKYSFQIYLLHTMATAALRIVLVKLGIYNDIIHFVLGMIVGLTASIIAAVICEKTVVLNILFFPKSTYKKLKKMKETGNEQS